VAVVVGNIESHFSHGVKSTCQYNSGWGPNVFDALLSLITVIPRYGNDINRTTINMDQAI